MSSNSEPASNSIGDNDSEDSIQLNKTESSSNENPPRKNDISNQSNDSISEDASSDSSYSLKKHHKSRLNSSTDSLNPSARNSKKAKKKVKMTNSDDSSTNKKKKRIHKRNHHSSASSTPRSYHQSDEDSASYYSRSNSYPHHGTSDKDKDSPYAELAKTKTGPLKIEPPKKKKHYQYEMVEENENFVSTDGEPEDLERAQNIRSQISKDMGLGNPQEHSKCCLLI